ncbi:hypothetical protein BofuT4_uP019980.1 [Botrytis cinerea T4]|uniref:Uncharacterized protein n=1 Tax=Botryotinia fuckeliana (strain T4) TaxID=999810 RepID=G2YJ05_BOTF4|nr:hypothetical protein BofuT4_uP019980.1 [Botrytis cinerea T4]
MYFLTFLTSSTFLTFLAFSIFSIFSTPVTPLEIQEHKVKERKLPPYISHDMGPLLSSYVACESRISEPILSSMKSADIVLPDESGLAS